MESNELGPLDGMNRVLRMEWIGSLGWNELLVPGNGSYLIRAKVMDLCIVGHTRSIVGTRKLPGTAEWWCIGSTVWESCQTSRSNTQSSSDPSRHSHRWINPNIMCLVTFAEDSEECTKYIYKTMKRDGGLAQWSENWQFSQKPWA